MPVFYRSHLAARRGVEIPEIPNKCLSSSGSTSPRAEASEIPRRLRQAKLFAANPLDIILCSQQSVVVSRGVERRGNATKGGFGGAGSSGTNDSRGEAGNIEHSSTSQPAQLSVPYITFREPKRQLGLSTH